MSTGPVVDLGWVRFGSVYIRQDWRGSAGIVTGNGPIHSAGGARSGLLVPLDTLYKTNKYLPIGVCSSSHASDLAL